MSQKQIAQFQLLEANAVVTILPTALKVHQTVLNYNSAQKALREGISDTADSDVELEEGLILSFEFTPFAVERSSVRLLVNKLFDSFVLPNADILAHQFDTSRTSSSTWSAILRDHLHADHLAPCALSSHNSVQITSRSVEVVDLRNITLSCVVTMAHIASLSPSVLRVTLTPRPTLTNLEARTHIQTGRADKVEPYRTAGLRGQNQVCGVADSGLNDLSAFFVDSSGAYASPVTSRAGLVETQRRKVIQYTSYADSLDTEGGHGTHVCGSIAGSSLGEFSNMDGIAPEGKIAFFDVGMTDRPFLLIPPLHVLFETQYNASARVHSNSWGSTIGVYSQNSFDVDAFTYSHDESLVLFAAGNSGAMGLKSVISPANAKNCVSVGAGQLRDTYSDAIFGAENYTVAYFSSLGPTFDGRIKPDIIAPGDAIMSAYAGDLSSLRAAVAGNIESGSHGLSKHTSCAVHQLDGTSMATPLVSGTALLIRQYFMDESFWAALCNPRHTTCQRGSFTPSGFLMKTLILASGRAVPLYSNPIYDTANTFSSFPLSSPPDFFQGYGEIQLTNILPLADGSGLDPTLDLIVFDRLEIDSFSTIMFEIDFTQAVLLSRQKQREHEERSREHRSSSSYSVPSPPASHPLKITLCWYDPPSLLGSGSSLLIHDLDLVVAGPDGDVYLGNKNGVTFNRYYTTTASADTTHTDEVNPNEQITISNPTCAGGDVRGASSSGGDSEGSRSECVFKVYVQSYALSASEKQSFALVITTDGTVSEPIYSSDTSPLVPTKRRDAMVRSSSKTTRNSVEISEALNEEALSSPVEGSSINNVDTEKYDNYTTTVQTHIYTTLHNNQYVTTDVDVPTCAQLDSVDVLLHYDTSSQRGEKGGDLTYSQAAKMYLTLIDPFGRIVVVGETFDSARDGGQDSHSPHYLHANNPDIVKHHWPAEWSSHSSGEYRAHVPVRQHLDEGGGGEVVSGLFGIGNWTLRLWNGGSSDSLVAIYNVTVGMNFDENNAIHSEALCDPKHVILVTTTPTKSAVEVDTSIEPHDRSPVSVTAPTALDSYVTHTIPFNKVSLGVTLTGWFNLKQDRVTIAALNQSHAQLQSVSLSLSAYTSSAGMFPGSAAAAGAPPVSTTSQPPVQSKGMDAWLLAVIVRAPNGLVSQSGGFEWLGQKDKFYNRRWPDLWLGKVSQGYDWVATRDVQAAELCSVDNRLVSEQGGDEESNSGSEWTVELAMGYALSIKPRSEFSGNITLVFKTLSSPLLDTHQDASNDITTTTTSPVITVNMTTTAEEEEESLPHLTSEREMYRETHTLVARIVVACIVLLTVIVMLIQIYKHHNKHTAQDAPHRTSHTYTQVKLHCGDEESNHAISGTIYASYQQPPPPLTTLQRHLDAEETQCLAHTCIKRHNSDSDLQRHNSQDRIANGHSPFHTQKHHLSGKMQHKIQSELMPLGKRGSARSRDSLLLDTSSGVGMETTPLFTMLKKTTNTTSNTVDFRGGGGEDTYKSEIQRVDNGDRSTRSGLYGSMNDIV
eukprot:gene25675-32159_t